MNTILIVDDEKPFLLSLAEGLTLYYGAEFKVLSAENGKKAVAVLKANPVDLVVTDLKMPVMDGFELLAYMSKNHPRVPVMVMTAFGNPEVEERLRTLDFIQYVEKPLDFHELASKIRENFAEHSGAHVHGVILSAFLRLVELEKKSCTLKVTSEEKVGYLFFAKGDLVDAETEKDAGEQGVLEILGWQNVSIEIVPGSKKRKKSINLPLNQVLLSRLKETEAIDQNERREEEGIIETEVAGEAEFKEISSPNSSDKQKILANFKLKEETVMTAQEKIKELTSIEGFSGAGIFTPSGESLAMLAGDKLNIKDVGALANNVLLNAQKASIDMGTGRGQLVHVEAERAHIIVRCLNEGTDPLKSQPGRAHIHLVLVLTSDAAIGLAKMKVDKIINDLAEDFRA